MATTTASKLGPGRGSKYRTSCDGCQAMKIKCGQEKPSCRRCSTQRLECVYSLSRRMGRPREKRNTQRQIHIRDTPPGDGGLGSALSSPAPVAPSAPFDATTTTTSTSTTTTTTTTTTPPPPPPSRLNDQAVDVNHHVTIAPPSSFPDAAHDWPISPPETDQHASNMCTEDSQPAARTSSLEDCLQMCSPLGINGASEFADLYDFLEDPLPPLYDDASTAPRPTSSAFDTFLSGDPAPQPNHGPAQQTGFLGNPCACAAGPSSKHASDNVANTAPPAAAYPPDPSPALCIAPEKDVWSTSGRSSSEKNAVGASRPLVCTCTTSVLQSIEAVKDTKRKRGLVPLDHVLTLEAGSNTCMSRLLVCPACRADTSTRLLGLVCIRMVLDLLHKAVREEFGRNNKHDRSDVYIGTFKVPPRVRSRFLHRALQARFRKLAAMLQDWEHLREEESHDCFSQAAAVLLGDVESALRMAVGWVDMGSAKV